MAVKIRLQRKGRTKAPFYHIVIADARAPRDGKYIERIGSYNPMTKPATIDIDRDAAYTWLTKGAQPTDTVKAILRFKGVLVKKHLMRGVAKGAMTIEEADVKLQEWIDAKDAKIAQRISGTQEEAKAKRKAISGEAKVKPQPVVETPTEVVDSEEAQVKEEATVAETSETEQAPEADETPVAEETSSVEETQSGEEEAPVAEEAPAVNESPAVEESPVTEEEVSPVEETPVAADEGSEVEEGPVSGEEAPIAKDENNEPEVAVDEASPETETPEGSETDATEEEKA